MNPRPILIATCIAICLVVGVYLTGKLSKDRPDDSPITTAGKSIELSEKTIEPKQDGNGPQDNDIAPPVSPNQDKDIVVNFRLEKNGKEVTIYRDNNTLVYTFGVPDKKPELEYRGPILAQVRARATLWGEGVESLAALSSALTNQDSTWTTWEGEPDIVAEVIAKMANSPESRGFISVSAMTGLVSQSAYIFRTGGWEYAVSFTEGRPINLSEDELDDYQSYSITVKGDKH